MKLEMKSTNGMIAAMLVIVAGAISFWVLGVSPKREEAAKLDKQASTLESELNTHEEEVLRGEEARREFPTDYQKLVVLGKAVPGDDDTASLLVQINRIAKRNKLEFREIGLVSEGEESEASAPVEGIPPTEASAALLPLGASIGVAGLGVMPYSLTFHGNFFTLADFIEEIDALVKTENEDVLVDGRLITLDGFALEADEEKGFPALQGNFSITTYLSPPGQGAPAGASPAESETAEATPAAATIEGTP
ncbi:MAG TPA: type 4a pilus biogenesis protein PilO [Solirubrobacterales bacterium]|nr:type 4a pilus biogenesis protein PilO [Solirubrobacterales bacterium]